MFQDKSLVLLCGDTEYQWATGSVVACLSLARRLELGSQGISTLLLSDFGPDEASGGDLDASLFKILDHALHIEGFANSKFRRKSI